uniref:Uncharacterized protein n=1 Tax=Arundo donax TaxID=35708 RepID=A0A0A9HJL9_ARUDO
MTELQTLMSLFNFANSRKNFCSNTTRWGLDDVNLTLNTSWAYTRICGTKGNRLVIYKMKQISHQNAHAQVHCQTSKTNVVRKA